MATKRKFDLSLRPIEQRRKPCSPCRCLLWSVILCIGIFAAICIVAVLALVYSVVANTISQQNTPFSSIYHNATTGGPPDSSQIVKPLVGEGETFDIVASVWVRNGPSWGRCQEPIPESLLFSDTVFRAVSAKDRGIMSNVTFQVPTSIFKQPHLLNFDLRGSLALIPSSSFLLDHAVHSIPSVPDNIVVPPVRPMIDETNRTLLDYTVDGYGIHVPLIEFHPVHSRCGDTPNSGQITSSRKYESRDQGLKHNALAKEWEGNIQQAAQSSTVTSAASRPKFTPTTHMLVTSNKHLSPLEGHPYIVTRTHLRVVDFTKILNFGKFNENFQQFREQSCRQSIKGTCPSWYFCPEESSHWNENGLWKTSLIQLGFPTEYGGNTTEWAYAPHLSAVKHATGPKDLIPIPVIREVCRGQTHHDSSMSLPVADEKMINVTWSITYSGRTPAKMMLGDIVGKIPINPGNNDRENLFNQDAAEYIHGIYGHRHTENSHPRRAFALTVIRDAFSACMIAIPQLFYWHTRISTAGISVPAAISWTLSDTISSIAGMKNMNVYKFSSKDDGPWITAIFTIWASHPISIAANFLRLKLITRVRVQRRGLLPIVKILSRSHAERSSARMDAELWRLRILIFSLLTLVYSLIHDPPMLPSRWQEGSEGSPSKLLDILYILANSLRVTGSLSQIALNFKRRTFACMYKITALCLVISDAEFYIRHSSIFLGDSIPSLSKIGVRDYIWTSIVATYLYQALRYPAEEYKDGEE